MVRGVEGCALKRVACLLAALYASVRDEGAVEVEARPTGFTVVSFRLPYEEYEALEEAASEGGETLSDYIRAALRLRRTRP